MRIAVIGAGNVGVAQAYELATDGHAVTVFEQRGSVAAEASFAHAGLSAPGCLLPWAMPGMGPPPLLTLAKPGAVVHSAWSLAAWRWALRSRRALKPRHAQTLLGRHVRLQAFSQQRLAAWIHKLKLEHERAESCLVLARDDASAQRLRQRAAALTSLGVGAEWIEPERCRSVEPGLNADSTFVGGVLLPQAEVSNARQFALLLRNEAQRLGVRFHLHSIVKRIEPGSPMRLTHLTAASPESTLATPSSEGAFDAAPTAPVTDSFDAIVVCAGAGAAGLLTPLGIKLPVMPVHGWSLTAPLRHHEAHPDAGPRAAVIDETHQVAVCRIGGRVRVTGGARIGGTARSSELPDTLYRVLDDWFPGTVHMSQAQRWVGSRATTPDGLPLLGASGVPGVWLNTAHGHSGWAFSAGSARLLADALGQRLPSIDAEGLGLDRWRG